MKKTSIKQHLGKYSIYGKRATTINHAFASAMAPVDEYSETMVDRILDELECVRDGKIMCVYCGRREAQTWDHLHALVKDNEPSGYGHKYGNLVPSCKDCNSRKGNRSWQTANDLINVNNITQHKQVLRVISRHLENHPPKGEVARGEKWERIKQIRSEILELMRKADALINSP